jgi:hypothetical protein
MDYFVDNIFSTYRTQGVLGININDVVFSNKKLLWLYKQYISLIEELRKNEVRTDEFLNFSNIGLKNNGNIGFFDLGYSYDNSDFNKTPEEIVIEQDVSFVKSNLNKLVDSLGLEDKKVLGSGFYGFAFDIGGNRVLKITSDKSEAVNSNKLKGKTFKHIANIYNVKIINIKGKELYSIILEKLKPFNELQSLYEQMSDEIEEQINTRLDKGYIDLIREKEPIAADFLSDLYNKGYVETWKSWSNKQFKNPAIKNKYNYVELYEISKWLRGSKTNQNDILDPIPYAITKALRKYF